nr:lipopolysaccharide biosynthesis protein [Haemophilus influenzae]
MMLSENVCLQWIIHIFHRFSESELGLYAMGAKIAFILSVFILAINKALVPYLFEKLKQGSVKLKDLHRWSLLSLLIVPIPSLVTLIVPEQWLLFFLGKHFIGVKYYIIVFLLSTSLTIPYLFLVNYLFYHGKTKEISFCSVLSTMIYLGALGGLIFTDVVYIPYASVLGALGILPVLYKITKRVEENEYATH